MSDRLKWTLVAASAALFRSASASAAAAAAVDLKRSADAFLISSLILSFLATSRAVSPLYINISDSEQRNRRNYE